MDPPAVPPWTDRLQLLMLSALQGGGANSGPAESSVATTSQRPEPSILFWQILAGWLWFPRQLPLPQVKHTLSSSWKLQPSSPNDGMIYYYLCFLICCNRECSSLRFLGISWEGRKEGSPTFFFFFLCKQGCLAAS